MAGVPLQLIMLVLPPLLQASSDNQLPQLEMTEQAAIAVDSECSEESDHCSLALRQLRVRTQKEGDLSSDSMLNASCSAYPACAALGLSANCCPPTPGGENLGCCSQAGAKTPSAAAQPSPSPTTQGATNATVAAQPSPSPIIPHGLPNLKTSAGGGNVMTLYHITNPEAGASILRSEFRPGSKGWCGGAIYFTPSPYDCWHKAAPGMLAKGIFMIEAQVDIGRSKQMPNYCTSPTYCTMYNIVYCGCDDKNRGHEFESKGYDSLNFNPGDGMEYIIWDPKRVKSMKQIPWPPGAPPAPPPPPPSPWGYIPPYYW